jgi:hypothetical protein
VTSGVIPYTTLYMSVSTLLRRRLSLTVGFKLLCIVAATTLHSVSDGVARTEDQLLCSSKVCV